MFDARNVFGEQDLSRLLLAPFAKAILPRGESRRNVSFNNKKRLHPRFVVFLFLLFYGVLFFMTLCMAFVSEYRICCRIAYFSERLYLENVRIFKINADDYTKHLKTPAIQE